MILEKQKEANILVDGISKSSIGMSLDLDSAQILMQMLSKNLYSDSIGSTIRECASNALDSHRRAGVDKPIVVSFKRNDSSNYEFSVEDFGIGLDADDVENIISKYGKSTKRNSSTELGMMGLGFKAPLAYSSSFYFVCRKNGMERKYMMYEGEDVNTIDLLYEVATDMVNGVKIIIPVKYYDRTAFINKSREQLAYFENVYFDFMDEEIKNDFVIFRSEHFQFSELADDNRMHICLDNVYYPIDFEKIGIKDPLHFPIALRISLTDGLYPTPNREALRYTQEGKQIILDKIELVADYFVNKYNESNDEDGLQSMMDYLSSKNRYVHSFNKKYNLNELVPFSKSVIKTPKIKGVEKLNLGNIWTNNTYWLGEYDTKVKIQGGKSMVLDNRYCHEWDPKHLCNIKVYVYSGAKLPGIKKDYIKSINLSRDVALIVRKHKTFKLDRYTKDGGWTLNYYKILDLENHPVSEWRQLIKEFQHIISLLTEDFIDLDKLVIPQTFIDARKKIKPQVVLANGQIASRKVKLVGEIVGKQAVPLLRYVDGKNCKWESTTYKLENLYKTSLLTVYGLEGDIEVMDKLYHIISGKYIRFVYFSSREIENVKKLNLHNWMSFDEFMKGENKMFKRTVTAYLIKKLRDDNKSAFDRIGSLENVNFSFYKKLNSINSYRIDWNKNNLTDHSGLDIMLKIAEEKNLFDTTIYQTHLDVKSVLERLPFINYLLSKPDWYANKMMPYIKDLCKYHKWRMDFKNYKHNVVEELSKEEEED
jgi:hypothetical protein